LIGSTTAEPLANAVSDALTADADFPCLGAVRAIGTGPGYAASFAGVEVGLASRDPRAAELSAIPDPSTVKLFAFGRTSTCFVVSTVENTVSTSWTKAALCAELKADESRATKFIGHNGATSTHVQRVATGCDVSVSSIRFDEVVDTLTVASSVAERGGTYHQ
jgi:ABC-type phosphate transport system substrate-binding protein